MTADLDGTAALITGASSGIGEATALALSERGAAVALVARRRDRLEALAARIEEAGGRSLVIEADIGSEEQARRAVEQTVAELGRLDTLINNAGVMLLGPFDSDQRADYRQMIEVNLLGAITVTEVFLA
jgi:NADP-dependent 3-hydroxy acid dehydrogenase YdfG